VISYVLLCERFTIDLTSLCGRFTAASQSLLNRFANALQLFFFLICDRIAQTPRIRFAIAFKVLCYTFASTLESLCKSFTIAFQSLCNLFIISSQSLSNLSSILPSNFQAFEEKSMPPHIFREQLKRVFNIITTMGELAALMGIFDANNDGFIICEEFTKVVQ
jgi:hypothetical protein